LTTAQKSQSQWLKFLLVNYYTQQTALKKKNFFHEYEKKYSQVQQINLQRLDKTWRRWLTPDQTGKLAGRPRFDSAKIFPIKQYINW
jgi:transposase